MHHHKTFFFACLQICIGNTTLLGMTADMSEILSGIVRFNDITRKTPSRFIAKFIEKHPVYVRYFINLAGQDIHTTTPLHAAALIDSSDNVLLTLLQCIPYPDVKKVIDIPDEQNRSALHIASACGFIQNVITLIKFGADPRYQDTSGNTSLHEAVMACLHTERICEILAQACPELLNKPNKDGITPLCHAALNGKVKAVRVMLRIGADITSVDRSSLEKIKSYYKKEKPDSYGNCVYTDIVRDLRSTRKSIALTLAYASKARLGKNSPLILLPYPIFKNIVDMAILPSNN